MHGTCAARDLCAMHYQRWQHAGELGLPSARDRAELLHLPETDKAYIAAFLDGEGTIGMRRTRRPGGRSGLSYEPYVSAGNTNPTVIAWLHAIFGGALRQRRMGMGGNRKPVLYQWDVKSRSAVVVCEAVQPYLRMKHRQAEILCQLSQRHSPGGRTTYDPEYWAWLETIYQELKELNRRGQRNNEGDDASTAS